jgi:hypothetical protein
MPLCRGIVHRCRQARLFSSVFEAEADTAALRAPAISGMAWKMRLKTAHFVCEDIPMRKILLWSIGVPLSLLVLLRVCRVL